MGGLMTDHTIDTASSALTALRIIVEAYAKAGVKTGDTLYGAGDKMQSVTGAQKNVAFMARNLAVSLLREGITRFDELPNPPNVGIRCHVVTDPETNISVRAYETHEFGRPLLVLDCVGRAGDV